MADPWYVLAVFAVAFAALFPDDARNLAKLLWLAPRLIRLWLSQRLMMARLWPRLFVDGLRLRARAKRLHNKSKSTNDTNNE